MKFEWGQHDDTPWLDRIGHILNRNRRIEVFDRHSPRSVSRSRCPCLRAGVACEFEAERWGGSARGADIFKWSAWLPRSCENLQGLAQAGFPAAVRSKSQSDALLEANIERITEEFEIREPRKLLEGVCWDSGDRGSSCGGGRFDADVASPPGIEGEKRIKHRLIQC